LTGPEIGPRGKGGGVWQPVVFGILRVFLRREERDEILGDLWEEWEERSLSGRGWRLWLLGQAAALAVYAVLIRPFRGRPAPIRTRLSRTGAGMGVMESWFRTVRVSSRSLARRPGYGILVVLTLAVGIGATTSLFSIVYGTLLKPLSFPDPAGLVRFGERGEDAAPEAIWSISVANFLDLDENSEAFQGLAAYSSVGLNLSGPEIPERVRGLKVTYDFFGLLGIPVAMGRSFNPEDDEAGADPVVILSRGLWQRVFGGDPDVLGEDLTLDGIRHRIVGVASGDFRFQSQVWLPFAWTGEERANRRHRWIEGVGRLRPWATPEAGLTEMRTIFTGLVAEHPEVNGNRSIGGKPLEAGTNHVLIRVRGGRYASGGFYARVVGEGDGR